MDMAKVFEQEIVIPTYAVGKEQSLPMFFEKRVYQGSSGKVYPNPVIEKIFDEKKDVAYKAVILENNWLKVIVLPELGGRIYTAYDKTNNYDFVYHNRVIKPALVGLLGPWISGGIEFNWPQHHRPTTYMPVNYEIRQNDDGSACVYVGEIESMFGLRHTTCIKLYPNQSYIEISTSVYNGENTPRTFLWWANPAYKVNDDTVTIMPPDVNAVMDHGKRAVSTFPISTGEYYKMDYSKGVDISRYKNIPVPMSFMAYKSRFDFIGGYDYGKRAGLLHIADHLVSPGKKQWTWGCGDFGQAWDRNLTDEDGPYVELMTGCFTDNQPDFCFIGSHETKNFTQYFMPYHEVGRILNADKNICFGCEDNTLTVYSSIYTKATISCASLDGEKIKREVDLTPCSFYKINKVDSNRKIKVEYDDCELIFDKDKVETFDIPSSATACPEPKDCKSIEELYLYGKHIEQYRHATRIAEDYYEEGLKRDPSDIRLNNAYGQRLFLRGLNTEAIQYFKNAVDKATVKNGNPESVECFYNLGVAQFEQNKLTDAYENFGRCLWGDKRSQGLYYLALIEKINRRNNRALEYIVQCLAIDTEDVLARNLYARLLEEKEPQLAKYEYKKVLQHDALNVLANFTLGHFDKLKRVSAAEVRIVASYLLQWRDFDRAMTLLEQWKKLSNVKDIFVEYYIAYAMSCLGKNIEKKLQAIRLCDYDKVSFAVSLQDKKVLERLIEVQPDYLLLYHLGNSHYDKRNYDISAEYWIKSLNYNSNFAFTKRNLALYFFNKKNDKETAIYYMESAYALNPSDARMLLELSQLYDRCEINKEKRLKLLQNNIKTVEERDDLYVDYLILLADFEHYELTEKLLLARKFHPWEGGEGKVTKLYKRICCALAEKDILKGDLASAEKRYKACFEFPHNLGEGKLILDYDNDVYFKMGEMYRQYGNLQKAEEMYKLALRGNVNVADDMYYNDTPIDYVYYIAMANIRLGRKDEANKIAESFANYSAKNKGKHILIDYFAVSLPDLLVWEQDLDKKNNEFCDYVNALALQIKSQL